MHPDYRRNTSANSTELEYEEKTIVFDLSHLPEPTRLSRLWSTLCLGFIDIFMKK